MTTARLGVLCTVASALLFGFTPILVRQLTLTGISSVTVVFYRNFFCVFITLLWSRITKQSLKIDKSQLSRVLLVGIFGSCATTLLIYSSYSYIGVGMATVLHFLYPAVAAILGWWWCKTKIGKFRLAGLVLSCIGLSFFLQGDASFIGVGLAVASAVTCAGYLVGMQKTGVALLPPCVVAFYFSVISSIIMMLYGMGTQQITLSLPLSVLLLCVLISVCTSFLGGMLLQMGVRNLDAGTAALLSLVEPISCTVFGILFLQETTTLLQIIGSVIIMVGLLVGMQRTKAEKAHDIANAQSTS